jgi:hypothetical protein
MEIIAHRLNTLEALQASSTVYGVEVDIRSMGDRLVIHHDPYVQGEDFDRWIDAYRHGTLILNVKEEGLEARLLKSMLRRGIERFFFLDQSFPFLIRTSGQGERRCAVRVSEYESVETALSLAGRIDWVWVDCFTRFPLSRPDLDRLKDAGFRLCLVSPELQGWPASEGIAKMRELFEAEGIVFDAVCTKRPELWS